MDIKFVVIGVVVLAVILTVYGAFFFEKPRSELTKKFKNVPKHKNIVYRPSPTHMGM